MNMKKLTRIFLSLLLAGIAFQACDNTKTYAESLEDERNAINDYIKANKIKVISVEEFEKDTVTNVAENEYVLFPATGVYMQIIDRGTGDTLKNRDEVLVRYLEYDIMADDTTYASNYNIDGRVDAFYYTHPEHAYSTYGAGQFLYNNESNESYLVYYYVSVGGERVEMMLSVPTGWLIPLRYIRDKARVKVIVPSKQGHAYAMNHVLPYVYDLKRIRIR